MNRVSMDALNTGLALGFGTNIRQHNADFASAAAHREATRPAATVQGPGVFGAFLAELAGAADHFVVSFDRRFAR